MFNALKEEPGEFVLDRRTVFGMAADDVANGGEGTRVERVLDVPEIDQFKRLGLGETSCGQIPPIELNQILVGTSVREEVAQDVAVEVNGLERLAEGLRRAPGDLRDEIREIVPSPPTRLGGVAVRQRQYRLQLHHTCVVELVRLRERPRLGGIQRGAALRDLREQPLDADGEQLRVVERHVARTAQNLRHERDVPLPVQFERRTLLCRQR